MSTSSVEILLKARDLASKPLQGATGKVQAFGGSAKSVAGGVSSAFSRMAASVRANMGIVDSSVTGGGLSLTKLAGAWMTLEVGKKAVRVLTDSVKEYIATTGKGRAETEAFAKSSGELGTAWQGVKLSVGELLVESGGLKTWLKDITAGVNDLALGLKGIGDKTGAKVLEAAAASGAVPQTLGDARKQMAALQKERAQLEQRRKAAAESLAGRSLLNVPGQLQDVAKLKEIDQSLKALSQQEATAFMLAKRLQQGKAVPQPWADASPLERKLADARRKFNPTAGRTTFGAGFDTQAPLAAAAAKTPKPFGAAVQPARTQLAQPTAGGMRGAPATGGAQQPPRPQSFFQQFAEQVGRQTPQQIGIEAQRERIKQIELKDWQDRIAGRGKYLRAFSDDEQATARRQRQERDKLIREQVDLARRAQADRQQMRDDIAHIRRNRNPVRVTVN
jgi:hypothetical protein